MEARRHERVPVPVGEDGYGRRWSSQLSFRGSARRSATPVLGLFSSTAAPACMKTIRPIRRTRGPTISWAPAHDSYYIVAGMRGAAAGIPPWHITQAALLEFESLVAAGDSPVQFGLLAGALCVCPSTKVDYLLIDHILPAQRELTAEEPLVQLGTELESLISRVERNRKMVLGWYLSGMDSDLQLDPEVELLHRRLFPHAWQVVLVRSQESGERGAFSRFETMTERFYTIPFFELLPHVRGAHTPGLRTAVRWANYRAAQSVVPLDAPLAAPIARSTRTVSPGRDSGVRSWLGTIRRRLTPVPARLEPGSSAARSSSVAVSRSPTDRTDRDAPAARVSVPTQPLPPPHVPDRPSNGVVPTAPPNVASSEPVVERNTDSGRVVAERGKAPPDIPQIFINGILVPLPVPDERTVGTPAPAGGERRAVLIALILFVFALALAAYLIGR
jgi:hypothetical protein